MRYEIKVLNLYQTKEKMESKYKKLFKCMVLDAIRMASAAIPVIDVILSFTIFWFPFDFFGIGKEPKTANQLKL